MLKDAQKEADAIVAKARETAREEKDKAMKEANAQIKEIAVEMAEKVISHGADDAFESFLAAADKQEEKDES